jgi:hypothetical protein
MTYMVLILVQKNYVLPGEPIIDQWQYSLFPLAFVIGFLASRYFIA